MPDTAIGVSGGEPHSRLGTGRALAWLVVIALAVTVLAWTSLALTRSGGNVAALWISNGVIAGLLVRRNRSAWPYILLAGACGELAARLIQGDELQFAAILVAVNVLEVRLVSGAIRHFVPDPGDRDELVRLSWVCTMSTLVACAVSAVAASFAFVFFSNSSFWFTWLTWFWAHTLGMAIFGTLTLVAQQQRWAAFGQRGRRADFAAGLVFLVAACVGIFAQSGLPLLFLAFPPLLYISFRHGFAGAVIGITTITVAALIASALGTGPIAKIAGSPLLSGTLLQLFIITACIMSFSVAITLSEKRRLTRGVAASELRFRLLAEHAQDFVGRLTSAGTRSFVSPSVERMLGWKPEELRDARWDLVHPDDHDRLRSSLQQLFAEGGSASLTYRMQHKLGHYVWMEVLATRVPSEIPGAPEEIVHSGRDVTARIEAQEALAASEARLQSIADNLPALIAYVDDQQRYRFVNAQVCQTFGLPKESILGRTILEFRGEEGYALLQPYVEAALRGEPQRFEGPIERDGRLVPHESKYVPEFGPDGRVRGFYALTFDISDLKDTEQQLRHLASFDSLTGLANRRYFEERLRESVESARAGGDPLALMSFDIDRFKEINDTRGHAVGDGVLTQFAERLRCIVRQEDLVARFGGDEFVALIQSRGSAAAAERGARMLIAWMDDPMRIDRQDVPVFTSIGIAVSDSPASTESLLELADKALYAAKQAGRNTYRVLRDETRSS